VVEAYLMKAKLAGLSLATALAATAIPSSSAQAAAYGANFQVAITYQNVGAAATAVQFDFYPEANGQAISFTPSGQLAANAGNSIAVGSVSGVNPGFKGSAVLSANQPVVATIVQYNDSPATTGITNRLLSNGFTPADAAPRQLVPTVLKNTFGATTYFSVQNVESSAVNLTVKFYRVGETIAAHEATFSNLAPNAAKYFDAGQIAALGTSFNGSAVVEATGRTVVTVNELRNVDNGGKSFEGTAKQSGKIYMPSALCKTFGNSLSSFYAVQNASTTETVEFNVTYRSINPSTNQIETNVSPNIAITPGGKASVESCKTGFPQGRNGSAVIEVVKGSGSLVAVGKVEGGGITSAFLGQSTGASRLAAPYVRWAKDQYSNSGQRYRSTLAIQNIGLTPTNVTVKYVDRNGTTLGTHTINNVAAGAKVNSTPADAPGALDACGRFGEYGSGADPCLGNQFGGAAIIEASSGGSLIAVVRVQLSGTRPAGEDYTALSIPNATQQ